jgi:regulation of enolase protein 1 (concanavalin A-like superfamily)
MFAQCTWLNEPAHWRRDDGTLHVRTDLKTDFWRETHYGFTRHSGHVFGYRTSGDFTAGVRVRGAFQALYDQAGIMVLLDERTWIKAGIEYSDGHGSLSSVLTVGKSDWALSSFAGDPGDFRIRATVQDGVLKVQASSDGLRWPFIRLCPFPKAASYFVGPMCCSPERAGLEVAFSDFTVTPPIAKALHDLT